MATLINGNGNLAIYAQQDADWYAALMGGQTVITAVGNQFAYELLASNTIGVKDGVIITKEGRRIQLDANAIDSFDIPTGAQGSTNYYIIGYHLVTGNQSEQTCETFVQLMENGTDTIPEGSFRDGDDEVFVSLYRVEQDDLTIGTITALLPQLSGSFQSQITELNNDLTDYSVNTPLRNVTYYNGKLYQITSTGQRGSEIVMNSIPKYVVAALGYGTVRQSTLTHVISNNTTKTSNVYHGQLNSSAIDTRYLTIDANSYYTTYTMVKDALFYPNNEPVPVVIKAGKSIQIGYAATGSALDAATGTFAWVE